MNWVKQVLAHVGGRYQDIDDEERMVWKFESPQYCRRVVDFLAHYVLQPQEWLFDVERLHPLGINAGEAFDDTYASLIRQI